MVIVNKLFMRYSSLSVYAAMMEWVSNERSRLQSDASSRLSAALTQVRHYTLQWHSASLLIAMEISWAEKSIEKQNPSHSYMWTATTTPHKVWYAFIRAHCLNNQTVLHTFTLALKNVTRAAFVRYGNDVFHSPVSPCCMTLNIKIVAFQLSPLFFGSEHLKC